MQRMIRYTVKPESVADNEHLVRQVYEGLRAAKPAGLRYATMRLDDGVSFVHLVSYANDAANQALTSLPAFKAFTAGIRERCATPPVTTDLQIVGAYGGLPC